MKYTLAAIGAGVLVGVAGVLIWQRAAAPRAPSVLPPGTVPPAPLVPDGRAPRDRSEERISALERDRDQWRAEALRLTHEPPAPPRPEAGRSAVMPAAPGAPAPSTPETFRRELLRSWLLLEGTNRWQALGRLGVGITSDDLRALASEALGTAPGRNYGQWSRILNEWVQVDPRGAAEWVRQIGDPAMAATAVSIVASTIARTDPAYAVEWLRGLPQGNARDMAVQNAAYPVAGLDPKLAIGLIGLISNENSRANAACTVVSQFALKDAEGAKAWVVSLPAGLVRDRALQQLCYATAPRKALEAFALADQIGEESARMQLTAYIAGQWARQDPAAASEWMVAFPAGHWRDLTVQSFALNLVVKDPAAAAEWAESIEDTTIRHSAMQGVAAQWLQRDRGAASKWIESSSLPASAREQLKNINSLQ
jgi:hypothetical protein